MKNKNTNCKICEITLSVPPNTKIYQYAPIGRNRLLIILSQFYGYGSCIYPYMPAEKYIFKNMHNGNVILEHNSEFYGC